ncbi:MAG TPA: hypothetical protein VGP76_03855 [Planctomycetaceae bacterium]|jgi:hypothetical protein|nr:hypothetical protein [Planctomycetaceae bacterium]
MDETTPDRNGTTTVRQEVSAAAAAIHIAVYNFVRVHNALGCTPAKAAGVLGEPWDMDRLFDEVMRHAQRSMTGFGERLNC